MPRTTRLRTPEDAFDQIPLSALPLGRPPRIMFHAGDVNLNRAISLAAAAKSHGADEILVVAPCIMKPATQDMLIKVIGMVASATTLPVYYYYYPSLYNVDFPMAREIILPRLSPPHAAFPQGHVPLDARANKPLPCRCPS